MNRMGENACERISAQDQPKQNSFTCTQTNRRKMITEKKYPKLALSFKSFNYVCACVLIFHIISFVRSTAAAADFLFI